jgi:uncharacterized membrane protein YhaH (DUF805 family)
LGGLDGTDVSTDPQICGFLGTRAPQGILALALLTVLIEIVFMALISAVGGQDLLMGSPASANVPMSGPLMALVLLHFVVMLALLVPSLAVTFRRLHDTNRKGWWILIGLIPLIGQLVLFIFYLLDGTPGPNRFGPDPKERSELQPA